MSGSVMDAVKHALGGKTSKAPTPPQIRDSLLRLVSRDADLPAVFIHYAAEQKMLVTPTNEAELPALLGRFLNDRGIRRVAVAHSPMLDRLDVAGSIQKAGMEYRKWSDISIDEIYDFAVTDVQHAVAEHATLVVRPSARQGRSMSLVPLVHVAIVERSQLVADMLDLFAQLARVPDRSNVILITGPSKTADIEMNVVTGVHGPNIVQVYLL